MKRLASYGAVWVGVFLLALLWHLPAAFVVKHLPLPPSFKLTDVQGPWWQGEGALLWQQRPAGRLSWSLGSISLLWGAPRFNVHWQLAQAQLRAAGQVSPQEIEITQLKGLVSTQAIQPLVPPSQRMLTELVQATLVFKDAQAVWAWQHHWPERLAAQGGLAAFKVMETALPDITWQITSEKRPQTYAFTGTGKAVWGRIEVQGTIQPQGYTMSLKVTGLAGRQPPAALTSVLRPAGSNIWQGQWQGRW